MESVSSSSPSPHPSSPPSADQRHSLALQHVADRIIRALRHPLRLIHRSGAAFFVLGSTGNVYKVTLAAVPSCTCPDRAAPCKHVLFVLLRVLGCSLDDACVWRRALRPCELARLLAAPTAAPAHVVAGARARERFHQLFSEGQSPPSTSERREERDEEEEAEEEEGGVCPICLEEMAERGLVSCATCGNSVHEECWGRWRRSRGRRGAICVMCRARWRRKTTREQEAYVNLAAYASEDDMMTETSSSLSCAT